MDGAPDFGEIVRSILGDEEPARPETDTDRRILDATLTLLGEYGERRLTMDDVAEAAKVGRKTVFRRFGSKSNLLSRVYEGEVRKAIAEMRAAVEGSDEVGERLTRAALALMDFAVPHPVTARLVRAEPQTLVALWTQGSPSGFETLRFALAMLARGEDRTVPPVRLEQACGVLARHLLSLQLIPPVDGKLPSKSPSARFVERVAESLADPAVRRGDAAA